MNFAELRFWEVLLCALTLLLAGRLWPLKREGLQAAYDRVALLALGMILLLAVSWKSFLIFLTISIGTYLGVILILRWAPGEKRRWLGLLVPIQLAPLLYYKYADFFLTGVLGLHQDALRGIVIPVGISFYTFQKIAFACDTLARNQAVPAPLDFMNFAGFFPQIVAGPIERRDSLLPQIQQFRFRWSPADLNDGVAWIALGLFFKRCLADNFAGLFREASAGNAWEIWLANVFFGLRIYYDFAGYSMVALGLARCLGVRLTLNFESPYCSASASEFWRRWHITLSQWLRDYIYIPLGGNRVRYWFLNLAVVFLVSGFWHGAGWNFIVWGLLHGTFLALHRLCGKSFRMPRLAAWALTTLGVFFAWLSFYETNAGALLQKATALFLPSAYSFRNLRLALEQWPESDRITAFCFCILAGVIFYLEWRSLASGDGAYCILRRSTVLVTLVALTLFLAPGTNNGFIYFAF